MKSLDISYNNVSDTAAFYLSVLIRENVSLEYLNMNQCTISGKGNDMIVNAAADIACLQCIMEDEIILQDVNIALVSNSVILTASLSNHPDTKKFNMKPLCYINFTRCHITEELSRHVGSSLSSEKIAYLMFSNCGLIEGSLLISLESNKEY